MESQNVLTSANPNISIINNMEGDESTVGN